MCITFRHDLCYIQCDIRTCYKPMKSDIFNDNLIGLIKKTSFLYLIFMWSRGEADFNMEK